MTLKLRDPVCRVTRVHEDLNDKPVLVCIYNSGEGDCPKTDAKGYFDFDCFAYSHYKIQCVSCDKPRRVRDLRRVCPICKKGIFREEESLGVAPEIGGGK